MPSPSKVKVLSSVLIVIGIGLLLFPAFWVAYTALHIGPAQAAALAAWEQNAVEYTPAPGGAGADSASSKGLLLSIPRLRLTRFVPDGASVAQLRRYGVGRISWTALPDRPGMVGIAGHRTTYGAPFFRLGALRPGDHIVITYRGARFDYVVTDRRIVRPAEVAVLRAAPEERAVALVTCAPIYSAKNRLVVLGRLSTVSSLSAGP